MQHTFAFTDVYRVMLGSEDGRQLQAAIQGQGISLDEAPRLMQRDQHSVYVTTLILDGETLQRLALSGVIELISVDNISERLRASSATGAMRSGLKLTPVSG